MNEFYGMSSYEHSKGFGKLHRYNILWVKSQTET